MIVTRFCSKAEYDAYMAGEELINNTDHYREGLGGSTSKGFCFTDSTPRVAWRHLKGIVTPEVCMVLDIPKWRLNTAWGKYADNIGGKGYHIFLKQEYCTTRYSLQTASLVRTIPIEIIATTQEIAAAKMVYDIRQALCHACDNSHGLHEPQSTTTKPTDRHEKE